MKDFSGSNQRGRNFSGQDLRGADFSNADIRSANFSKADLSGANFTGAKAGLQRRWLFVQLVISFALSATLNFVAAFLNAAAIFNLLTPEAINQYTIIPGTLAVLLLAIVFFAIARQGLTARAFTIIVIAVAVVVTVAVLSAGDVASVGAGVVAFVGAVAVVIAFVGAGDVAGTVAVFGAGIGAGAGTRTGAVAVAVAGVVAVAVATLFSVFNIYIAWRASKNDEKFALAHVFGVVFSSIGGTRFYQADLTGSNFTNATLKSTNFREATLTHVCWKAAQKLDRARVGDSILQYSAVRELLVTRNGYKKSYVAVNLEGANLQGVNLDAANLTRANLSHALLYDAHLKAANLCEALAVGTDFTHAYLTGACLEAWNIDHTTNLDRVDCQYVFLLDQPDELGNRDRRPHNPDAVFAPGDFEKLYKKIINTVQILMRDGINREAFAAAFQKLMQDHPSITQDSIQALEKKGNDILLTIEVPQTADKAKIAQSFDATYRDRVQQLEAENKQLQLRSLDLKEIAIELARKPTQITNQLAAGDQTMNDNTERNQTVNIGGNVIGSTINLGEINGAVSNAINQLPSTADATQPGLKEHLIELQATIEAEPTLSIKDKADALESVKALAEAAQDPQQPEKQGLGRKAIKLLKGTIATLPDAAKLADACKTLLPLIAKSIGLPIP